MSADTAALFRAEGQRDQARAERDAANAQCAKTVREREQDRDQIVRLLDLNNQAENENSRLRAALETAERWLRTISVNPQGCAHPQWAREALDDVASAKAATS